MDTPSTPTNPFAPIDRNGSAPTRTAGQNAARGVALLVGAGLAVALGTSAHTAAAVSFLMLAALLLVVGAVVQGHRSGRRPLRLEQFRPSAPMAGNLPLVR
ncbi:hypothetical protein PSU4_38590 [Pseudonocardia sulfidoxydans NBRC 16205]|uniref:Uncharacterized protein n=1 Tax=Pseudonocardia sulfidoxydans NBRC 16205 TaxID=1223511 RepID=A0A511DJB9_9PSEU|nr:hypothetical protein [Pseudonocardia sulfidoxydans]GEL24905.1 hypothetical protein PSU4_38590 [Pseudonocardia sulfidoxydans NBRC 16205]